MSRAPDETWSTRALFERCIVEATSDVIDEHAYWAPIYLLQQRDVVEVWDLVTPLARHADENLRALVADVLRWLGGRELPRRVETVALFREMVGVPQPSAVISAIATAFVDLADPAAVELLLPFVRNAEPAIRSSVVHGLLPVARLVVPALIELSRDSEATVREWATFGLGSQLGERGDEDFVDTPEVREALAARLDDEHEETRAEAAVGLALRGDPRALPVVRRALKRADVDPTYFDAAAALADESLYGALQRFVDDDRPDARLEAAVEACRPCDNAAKRNRERVT